jgi:hypothetical protein
MTRKIINNNIGNNRGYIYISINMILAKFKNSK